jgi:hypothetical protein
MTRRHNRQFYLDDDLTQCSGTGVGGHACNNWGKADGHALYWCHHHKGQAADAIYTTLERVEALAASWEARGESDMAYSKTIPDDDVAMALLTSGADMVENARHIRAALGTNPYLAQK